MKKCIVSPRHSGGRPELGVNLWHLLDQSRMVSFAFGVQLYELWGTDGEKFRYLQNHSMVDHEFVDFFSIRVPGVDDYPAESEFSLVPYSMIVEAPLSIFGPIVDRMVGRLRPSDVTLKTWKAIQSGSFKSGLLYATTALVEGKDGLFGPLIGQATSNELKVITFN